MMRTFIKFADNLSTSMGKAFSWCIVILMGGTCYEVFMAYVLNAPTLWNFDFSLQMYGAIFMMAGAYTLSTEAHVRGDVIYRLFKPRTQGWIDLAKSLIPLAGILLTIQGISEVFRSIICIQTGQWPARLVVAEETEKILMRAAEEGGEPKDVI
jgi:TRAP-type mannitol/chloroaromatic compound transport system permease small subunit